MERRVFAAAHAAAEEAALALLARDHLSRADFGALYAPFDGVASSRASRIDQASPVEGRGTFTA
jgi:hypothetical protein